MSVGAYWGAEAGARRHPGGKSCLSLSLRDSGVMPGQGMIPEAVRWRPQ